MANYDLVIRGGIIHDGTAAAPWEGDVAVRDDKIVEVGNISGNGSEEIDAHGCIVTPGFIDIHTHYDGQVTWESRLAPSSNHGVTTVVMGNCGVGFAPCRPEDRERLINVMEGVEDIPQVVMAEGLPWTWESFPEYLDVVSRRSTDIDIVAQVPHAAVRVFVMGERGIAREAPSDEELDAMTQIVAEGVRAGAFGVSTSRSLAHRNADGELAPTVTSEERELLALARGLREAGRGVFQLLPGAQEGKDPVEEMAMLRRIITESGGHPLSFSLLHTFQHPENMDRTLELLSQATAEGFPIKAQVFARGVGLLFGLDLSFHPFRFHPSYREIEHLPLSERVTEMRDPARRARILAEKPVHTNPVNLYFMEQTGELFPLGNPPNYEPAPEERLSVRAVAAGITVDELAYDMLLENGGHAQFLLLASNYVGGSLEPVRRMLEHPDTLIALGDGGAHYGTICDSSFTTFLLSYWTRDRKQARLPLARVIHDLTLANARAVGLSDRGRIAPGLKADINVIDYNRLRLEVPHMVRDLPAGGGRLLQEASGYVATIKSGEITYREGKATGALPGRLLRSSEPEFQLPIL